MLFHSFAHRLLLIFGVVILAVLAVLAAKLGWLGEPVREWVDLVLHPARAFYSAHKDDLDFAAKIVGASGTALGAAWTVHKGWHYAERNLPKRLRESNARWKDAIETSRVDAIPALVQIASISPPLAAELGPFRKLVSWVHDPSRKALAKCEEELDRAEKEFGVLTSSKVRCRAEVVTAYLALGSQLQRVAPDQGQRALDNFKKALKANRTDLDALELTAKQQLALGFDTQALDSLQRMETAACNANNQLRHARALRYQAEVLHRSANAADWARARAKLVAAISSLSGTDAFHSDKRNCELALAHELLANVQITRERFVVAQAEIDRAIRLFSALPNACGRDGVERLKCAAKRLSDAKKDLDDPDVPD